MCCVQQGTGEDQRQKSQHLCECLSARPKFELGIAARRSRNTGRVPAAQAVALGIILDIDDTKLNADLTHICSWKGMLFSLEGSVMKATHVRTSFPEHIDHHLRFPSYIISPCSQARVFVDFPRICCSMLWPQRLDDIWYLGVGS